MLNSTPCVLLSSPKTARRDGAKFFQRLGADIFGCKDELIEQVVRLSPCGHDTVVPSRQHNRKKTAPGLPTRVDSVGTGSTYEIINSKLELHEVLHRLIRRTHEMHEAEQRTRIKKKKKTG